MMQQDLQRSLTGRVLGGYQLESVLGSGGGGTVYRAIAPGGETPDGDTTVALKVFKPEFLEDAAALQRLRSEAEAATGISHPHVARVHEIASSTMDGQLLHWIAMELVEGETLGDRGALSEAEIGPIADQLLDALGAVHAAGMTHRDLKPRNVVLSKTQGLKLMDLGVARLQPEGLDATQAEELVGSLTYTSPEQFVDQDHVGPRADIYAFGVLLYEMTTGVNPYDDVSDLGELLARKVRGQVARPVTVQPGIAPFLDEVILTCLRSDSAARFASCDALRTILREREASGWWKSKTEGTAFSASVRALHRLQTSNDATLRGRGVEMERLHGAFEHACAGNATIAVLAGAAGTGKSRLLHDFLERVVAPDGPLVWAARCPETGGRAHHAFFDAAGDALGDKDLAPDAFVPAMTALVRTLVDQRPMIIAIEDLQFASSATIALIEHLHRVLSAAPILFLVTYRSDEGERGGAQLASLLTLSGRTANVMVNLQALDRETSDAVLTDALGSARAVRAIGWPVFQASEGNPRFLLETLAHLKETGALEFDGEHWNATAPLRGLVLPKSTRDLLTMRLRALDDDRRAVLDAAAIIGVEFDAMLLARLLATDHVALLKKLAVLQRDDRLVASTGQSPFRFASHGLRRLVYDGIPRESRRMLHSACADAIVGADRGVPSSPERAHAWVQHLLRAGRLSDAGDCIGTAIEHAATRDHGSKAIQFLEEVLRDLDPDRQQLCFDTSMLLAELYGRLGRHEEQRVALARAADEAKQMGDRGPRARVQIAFARVSYHTGALDRAESDASRGLMLAGQAGDPRCEAECLHLIGVIASRRGKFDEGAEILRDALAIRRTVRDRAGEAETLIQLGAVMPKIGEAADALASKQSAVEILHGMGDRRGEGAALNDVGRSMVDNGRIAEALTCYERSVRIAREFGDLPAEAAAIRNIADVFVMQARIDEAKETFERALDIFIEVRDSSGEAKVLDEMGVAMTSFGARREALDLLTRARDAAVRSGEFSVLVRVLRHLAVVHHELGDHPEAWHLFDRALGIARNHTRLAVLAEMGNAAQREGDFDRATELMEESLEERLEGHGNGRRRILSLARLARTHHLADTSDKATQHARTVESLLAGGSVVHPHDEPEIYYSLGIVFAGTEEGTEHMRRANELLSARSHAIRSVTYRDHYLTSCFPNKEIIEEARRLAAR